MNFSQEEIKGVLVKHVHLSRATKEYSEDFKKFLIKDINENGSKIIIDLGECEFIDSTFISALVIALKTGSEKETSLKIIANHSDVQSILELTGMVRVFNVYKEVNEALADFNHQ